MARPTPRLLAAQLIHGYLASAASITAGVPSTTILPRRLMDDGKDAQLPQLVTTAAEVGDSAGGKRQVVVSAMMYFRLANATSTAPADAASTAGTFSSVVAEQYLDLIERRLRDRSAFAAYVATLDSDTRDGWTILSMRGMRQPEVDRAEANLPKDAGIIGCAVEIQFAWAI